MSTNKGKVHNIINKYLDNGYVIEPITKPDSPGRYVKLIRVSKIDFFYINKVYVVGEGVYGLGNTWNEEYRDILNEHSLKDNSEELVWIGGRDG